MGAANTVFTGGGTTLTLATTGITFVATSIGGNSCTVPKADFTDLSDAVANYKPGDVMDHDEVTVTGFMKASDFKTLRTAIDAATKVVETITKTFRQLSGESTAALETSTTAFITSVTSGDAVNNEPVTASLTFCWGAGSTLTNAT